MRLVWIGSDRKKAHDRPGDQFGSFLLPTSLLVGLYLGGLFVVDAIVAHSVEIYLPPLIVAAAW